MNMNTIPTSEKYPRTFADSQAKDLADVAAAAGVWSAYNQPEVTSNDIREKVYDQRVYAPFRKALNEATTADERHDAYDQQDAAHDALNRQVENFNWSRRR
jgi:hypothetical protein